MQILPPYELHRLRQGRRVAELELGAWDECLGAGRQLRLTLRQCMAVRKGQGCKYRQHP